MTCPLCGVRKAKRACPALGREICAVCCGTKRLVEIRCPAACVYLASARAHPPAVAQRQEHADRSQFLPLLAGLSEREARVLLAFTAVIARHKPEPFQPLLDVDIQQAAGAIAATFETAARGIVYEHRPASLPAERLGSDMKTMMAELSEASGGRAPERQAAVALRRLEAAAREHAKDDPRSTAFRDLLGRMLADRAGHSSEETPAQSPAGQLILP